MLLFYMLPSWSEIRQRLDRDMAYQTGGHFCNHLNEPAPSRSLIIRRFDCVRRAFVLAEWEAGRILVQRFSDLDISSIIKDLIDVVAQMAMIVVGSAFTGGLVGAGVGSMFFGVGAYPGGAIGTALGLQASTFILGVLGLKSIAEYVVDGFPRIVGYYLSGIKTAWQGPREQGLNPFMSDDPYAQNSATQDIAKGHVEVVLLLLGAVVEYLTRGRGDARLLAQEMRASPKGERLGQWMLENEDALKKRPDLQRPEPSKSALDQDAFTPVPQSNREGEKSLENVKGVIKSSETIGQPVEAVINGRKRLLRVDIEPNGKLQIQSGGGKDSIVDFRPNLSKPLAPQIDKAFKRLPQSVRDQLIRNAEKGLKRLQETGNI
ncbi:hypothetical protein ALQ08_03733 [Pseudomonas syringae pv. delphinii]|uniref:NAD(+)--protein-arginine ADP-ribosyltransferase Tre1-like N-terminal domain-containing protein n=1 Tax=Pseudomonas syringae pv. delphinii TaxID=192088 RepID=A0A0P9Q9Q3_9PSED|nr:hypothetical protein [Pseudomonas syringae group genomosp. 3]KPX27430.1 Uncharacterized protein ALO72_02289 [Pseudomonas syringae pv. delphinii]RMP13480.1 hypothetical protein ALQ28_02841 [Pseudomonas syringae pv. delphinii]RMP19902.1 hypothetical protein ALQ27_00843 [Pseudomonas syringae pv. delphinii]RMQ21034.1 hypothetical protein ALQ08_03733 [Pseudomonas syringae pv. delphinii]